MAQQSPKQKRPPSARPPLRQPVGRPKHRTRREREARNQRRIITIVGSALAIALVVVGGGILYDQLWLTSRPVAQVGTTTMTRADYTRERRASLARSIGQNLYFSTFGEQFAQQFLSQIAQQDASVTTIASAPVDDATVSEWQDAAVVSRGAAALNLAVSDGEVAQRLIRDYGAAFGPPVTPTLDLTPTASLAPTSAATAAATSAATAAPNAPTATAQATATRQPTTTPPPSATPAPSSTPTPSPQPEVALSQVDAIMKRMYQDYVESLSQVDATRKPRLTVEDFTIGVKDQFRRQLFTEKVKESLVTDPSFTPKTDPSSIEVAHILIKATLPVSATQAQRDAALAARKPDAEKILAELTAGKDFATIAEVSSEDFATRALGGTLPAFDPTGKTKDGMQIDQAIVAAAAGLQEGKTSGLVQSPFGWHIVKLIKRTVDTRETQLEAARTKAYDVWLAQQRTGAALQRFPTLPPTEPPPPTGTAEPLPTADLGAAPPATPPPTPVVAGPALPTPTATTP